MNMQKNFKQADPVETLTDEFALFRARRAAREGALIALTIKPLWIWAILHGGKDVENRRWKTNFRGRVLLHASKTCTEQEFMEAWRYIYGISPQIADNSPDYKQCMAEYAGKACAVADITDCVSADKNISQWQFDDCYGFKLQNVRELEKKLSLRGSLGFFKVDKEIASYITAQNPQAF